MATRYMRITGDHFEPAPDLDPQMQKRLRGLLEKIDYTAFVSNKEVMAAALGAISEQRLQRLAVAAAQARARWVAAALEIADQGKAASPADVERLSNLHAAYEEFTAVYEALRRMIERGYVKFAAPEGAKEASAEAPVANDEAEKGAA
ncbi:MAG: hypothetical protein PVI23_16900 [Maricaulaceae bacterium]|jgi:hypothetical protein